MTETKEVVLNSRAHLQEIVKAMYRNGSDNRSQKNGSPDALVDKVWTTEHIATCGIFGLLPRTIQDYINSKAPPAEYKTWQTIAKFIVEKHKAPNSKYFVRLSERGKGVLSEIIDMNASDFESSAKKLSGVFKMSKMFIFQERQKIMAKIKTK